MNVTTYNTIVDQWADALYRFALSLCRDDERSKDAVQDAFVKLWERKDQVNQHKVKSYLFTTVHHKIIDGFRRDQRHQGIDDTPINDSTLQHNHDVQEVLHRALNTLPEMQKSVILLRDYEGYNYDEIAEITGLSLSQVKVYIFRGRQKLKTYIGSIESII
ncbi:MAG: RNA polymerase sigma factor [Salibacteraceae bacterium]